MFDKFEIDRFIYMYEAKVKEILLKQGIRCVEIFRNQIQSVFCFKNEKTQEFVNLGDDLKNKILKIEKKKDLVENEGKFIPIAKGKEDFGQLLPKDLDQKIKELLVVEFAPLLIEMASIDYFNQFKAQFNSILSEIMPIVCGNDFIEKKHNDALSEFNLILENTYSSKFQPDDPKEIRNYEIKGILPKTTLQGKLEVKGEDSMGGLAKLMSRHRLMDRFRDLSGCEISLTARGGEFDFIIKSSETPLKILTKLRTKLPLDTENILDLLEFVRMSNLPICPFCLLENWDAKVMYFKFMKLKREKIINYDSFMACIINNFPTITANTVGYTIENVSGQDKPQEIPMCINHIASFIEDELQMFYDAMDEGKEKYDLIFE